MKLFKKYTFWGLCLLAGLSACKKDLGTYVYKTVNVPATAPNALAEVYNVELNDNLVINPKVEYQGDTSNLQYQWLVYIKSPSSYTIGPATEIATTRQLNRKMNISSGNYYLELIITDKSNNNKTTTRTLLNILASMENGWLVLHTANNLSDVDYISNSNLIPGAAAKRIKNMAATLGGGQLKGEAQFIGFSRRSNSVFNYITVGTDQELKRFNGFSFAALTPANAGLFRRPQANLSFMAHLNSSSNELIIDKNGLLQSTSWGAVVEDALYGGVFNGDYKLAPYIVFNDFSAYGALVYDQKYQKFLYTTQTLTALNFSQFKPSAVTTPAQPFDPLSVGKEMLFMDRGFNKHAYAFFKDNTGNGRYLYVLNQTLADAGGLAVAAYNLTGMPDIQDAKFFQIGDVGNVALYATEKVVYKYDYSGSMTAAVVFSGIPASENITCMRIFKPRLNINSSGDFALTNNAVLYVATWDGTQGRLYELAMNVASGAVNPSPLNVYSGFGKIKDMIAKFRGTGI